jgi:hypothetical protein
MDKNDNLELLSATIAEHARKVAGDEWAKEHYPILRQILSNSGIGERETLSVGDREIPVETIVRSLRERFLATRSCALTKKLTDEVVSAAFKKVTDEEEK